MRYDIYWYEVITSLECLPFENDEKYFLTLWIVEGCNPVRELNNVDDLFSGPSFCAGVISCVETRFASPWADGQTILQELVQDSLGDVLEWYDYNDAMNTWLQNNPFIAAASVTYDNTTSLLTATNVQDAIDEIASGICASITECIETNWLPDDVDLFTLDWVQVQTGDTLVTTNTLSSAWLVLTSTVNGVADSEDLTTAVQNLIDASTDTVTNTVAWHQIATHTSVDGTVVNINETVTAITAGTNWFTYTSEDGSTDDVTFTVVNPWTSTAAQEVRVNGTLVATIPLNQYDIQIDNAGSDFDISDDSITITETNGDTATISFAKYNVTVTTQPNGDQLIYQNGNLLGTIYKNGIDINYDNTTSGLAATNVQAAIDEINSAVVSVWGWFTITDTTNTQTVVAGDTMTFLGQNLITPVVSATDTVTIGFNTTWATNGQVPYYNWTNVVWTTPLSENIYTDDGTLLGDRVVSMNANHLRFADTITPNKYIQIDTDVVPQLTLNTWTNNLTFWHDGMDAFIMNSNNSDISTFWQNIAIWATAWNLQLTSSNFISLDSTTGNYVIGTAPDSTTTVTQAIVRDVDWKLFLRNLATLSTARYTDTWTPVANVETVHTHALTAGEDIQVQVRDSVTKEIVDVEIRIISATTFWVTSTTTDELKVVAL